MPPRGPQRIYLIGFSGSGKSLIGSKLASRLKLPFYDTDTIIEQEAGQSIAAIFEKSGESRFRSMESRIIGRLCRGRHSRGLAAVGGGAFQSRVNREYLLESGLVVYLSCSVEEIYRRLRDKKDRPLLDVRPRETETLREARMRRIRRLLARRLRNYRKAHIHCSTTRKDANTVMQELLVKIRRYHAQGHDRAAT